MSENPVTPAARMLEHVTSLTNLSRWCGLHGSINPSALAVLLEAVNDLLRAAELDVNHRAGMTAAVRCNMALDKCASAAAMYNQTAGNTTPESAG